MSGVNLNKGCGADTDDIYMHVVSNATANPIEVSTQAELEEAATLNEAYIKLTSDITLSNAFELRYGMSVTLDLNSHNLNRSLTEAIANGHVVKVNSGCTFTVADSSNGEEGIISGGYTTTNGGGIVNESTLVINGGSISGNHANTKGAGIINYGTLTINGGAITNNESDDAGGVYNESGATLVINGGTISGNHATTMGSGGISNHGTTYLYGGTISNNTATINGGGIWTNNTLTISGGTIEGNSANCGGGVYVSGGTFNVEGNPIIFGNTKADGQPGTNVYLPNGKKFTITGTLEGANLGFFMENYGIFTTGFRSHNASSHPGEFFTPDNSTFYVTLDGDEARLNISLDEVAYVNRIWDNVNHQVTAQVNTCTSFTKLEGNASDSYTQLNDGWYVVYHNVTYKKCIHVVGDVHLILVDGATLTANDGIYIKKNKTLTVYGQVGDLGKIYAHSDSGPGIGGMKDTEAGHFVVKGGIIDAKAGSKNNAGIGGGNHNSGIQSVTIYGGNVRAEGKSSGAGIGKGQQNNLWETVTIYGGDVTAQGGNNAAGIGGGEDRGNGEVVIWGGKVTAKGGVKGAGIGGGDGGSQDQPITIHGGEVHAIGTASANGGAAGAGIGGGNNGHGGTVTINDGIVIAYGYRCSAGIGGGAKGNCGNVTINGGDVTASCLNSPGYGAGIGSGKEKHQGGSITINGGIVNAKSDKGAGIGGGYKGSGATINITDGLVVASSKEGAGIGGGAGESGGAGGNGGAITISGGVVIASSLKKGAGIGGGNGGNGGTVNIYDGHVTATGGDYDFDYWAEPNYASFIKTWGAKDYHSAVAYFIASLIFSGNYGGAGIGGGDDGNGANVNITGGTVIASASNAYSIGKGDGGGNFGNLNVDGAHKIQERIGDNWVVLNGLDRTEKCQSKKYVKIEPCLHEEVSYTILSNALHAVRCHHCLQVSSGQHSFDENNQCVCGYGLPSHTVTIYQASENGDGTYNEGVTYTIAENHDFYLPDNEVAISNLCFEGWMIGTPTQVNGYEVTGGETLYAPGYALTVTSDVSFIARYKNYWNGTGSGSESNPFLIATTADLIQLSDRVNAGESYDGKHFLLVNDLEFDASANNFTAIGNNNNRFNGTFDGNEHSISGININVNTTFQGLFGAIGPNGAIKGVTLQDCSIIGSYYVGSIVGTNDHGTVERCLALGCTVQGSNSGSIVGYNNGNLRFNYYTGTSTNGIGYDNNNASAENIFGAEKGYTITCAEGLTIDYVLGAASGSEDNAIIEHQGIHYAASGISISLKVESPLGYTITSIICNGTTLNPDAEGIYHFTMLASNVSITSTQTLPTFFQEGSWDDEENWSNGFPVEGSDVVIAAPATIESEANVGHITFQGDGCLTIADGGQLFHNENLTATLEKEIVAYESDDDGWFTIASPVTYDIPVAGHLATESAYDLYLYHEPTHYWWNVKKPENDFILLQHLEGYLYANEENVTLSFAGLMLATNNTVSIPLSYTEAAGNLKGYNLVGNPFTRRLTDDDAITIEGDDLTTYLIAEGDGELVAYTLAERPIEPGEGFFVQATEEGQNLVINQATRGEQTKQAYSYLRIEAGKEGFYDRAYVQVGGGNGLRKMCLGNNKAEVSVWNDGKDWAAATIETTMCEIPIHFKAKEDGIYTLTVSTDNVEIEHLHLIDNLTGVDVDLKATPSYTFNATTSDYTSRFRLVYRTNGEDNPSTSSGTFAYICNDEIIITDVPSTSSGTSTLQVIDMMGRVIVSSDMARRISTSGIAPSVYVLRLINGDDVKTQKIVVR